MQVRNIEPSFGMAVKFNPSVEKVRFDLTTKLGPKKFNQAEDIITILDKKPAETIISIDKKGRLSIATETDSFKENFLNSPLKILKKTLASVCKNTTKNNE